MSDLFWLTDEQIERLRPVRQAPLPASQPHRDHVRPPQGLAPRRHPYDRCPTAFFSAIALAATVIFWL